MALSPERRVIDSPSLVRNFLVAAGAGALVLAASLVNFLRFHDYPLLAVEVAPIYLGIGVIGAVLGAVYLLSGRLVRIGLEVLLVGVAVDLNSEAMTPIWVALAAALLLALVVRRPLLAPIGFMALVALVLVLAGFGSPGAAPPPAAVANGRPVILHLILDEHIGIEGLPAENAASPALREELKAFYLDRGFRLYGRAYSEHMHTVNAVPQIMNLGETQPSQKNQARKGVKLDANAYFDRLRSLGYSLTVYQNGFVDFCGARDDVRCVTYPYARLGEVATSALPRRDKTATVAVNLIALSDVVIYLAREYDLKAVKARARGIPLPALALDMTRQMSTIPALAATDRLIADLETARPGQAYIAHLLLPHGPYATGPDCRLRPRSRWGHRRSRQPIRAREGAYFDQVRCTMRLVSAALDALERSPGGRDAIVIIHGDHGSRITVNDPMAWMRHIRDRDLIAVFSTLFAVRARGVEAGYEAAPAAAPALFGDFVESGFAAAPAVAAEPQATVMLAGRRWRPERKATLPADW